MEKTAFAVGLLAAVSVGARASFFEVGDVQAPQTELSASAPEAARLPAIAPALSLGEGAAVPAAAIPGAQPPAQAQAPAARQEAPSARASLAQAAAGSAGFDGVKSGALAPVIDEHSLVLGNPGAPHTLVAYSDLLCGDSANGAAKVAGLLKRYGKDLRVVLKHRPLAAHDPYATEAAHLMQAVASKDKEKAVQFFDVAFQNLQAVMALGPKAFFSKVIQHIGLDVTEIEKLAQSAKVQERVAADKREAVGFGFKGTPSYVLDGQPITGRGSADRIEGAVLQVLGKSAVPAPSIEQALAAAEVRHKQHGGAGVFELEINGSVAELAYELEGRRIVFYHTGVPGELGGHGVGTKLVKAGLDYARAQGLTVVPACPFVAAYLKRHPEQQDLLAKRK